MAMNFAKGNRSMAFNPTSAFPLDARSYFESYEAAAAAALTAKEAGDSTTTYYYGQNIVVVENSVASFYIIQPDGTLGEVGGKVEINEKVFAKDEDGKLNLYGFADAVEGAQLVKSADGKLSWIKPDATTVEGLQTAVKSLEDAIENMYTKDEVDLAIETGVANAAHLKRKIVESLEAAEAYVKDNDDFAQYIYMVPTGLVFDSDKYDEYLAIVTPEEERILEKVGSWEVDLTGYATKDEVTAVTNALNAFENHLGFIGVDEDKTVAEVLDETFVKKDDCIITAVESAEFTLENKKLGINKIDMNKVDGLATALENKVSVEADKGLVETTLIGKLRNLLNITGVSNDFEVVENELKFSTTFSNRVNNIEGAVTWGAIE
jgi:hypothetical protein